MQRCKDLRNFEIYEYFLGIVGILGFVIFPSRDCCYLNYLSSWASMT